MANGVSSQVTVYTRPAGSSPYRSRVPDICALDQNTIVVVWRNDYNQSAGFDKGDIVYSRSTNGGSTWSVASVLKARNATWVYTNAQLYYDNNVLYAYIGRTGPNQDANYQHLIGVRSLDQGLTWQDIALTFDYSLPMVANTHIVKVGTYFIMGFYRDDDSEGPRVRFHSVVRSTDLLNWTKAQTFPNSNNIFMIEGWIHTIYNSGAIGITMRTDQGVAYSSISSDQGATWSQVFAENELPNNYSKPVFINDTNNQYVYMYNTNINFGIDFPRATPIYDPARQILNIKVHAAGSLWSSRRTLVDIPNVVDTYPAAVEVSPGKFFMVWESNYTNIIFAKLDLTGLEFYTEWNSIEGWTAIPNGGIVAIDTSRLRLKSSNSSPARITYPRGPNVSFIAEFVAQVAQFTSAPVGVSGNSLAFKAAISNRRLMIGIEEDGVYAITSTSGGNWIKVYNTATNTSSHIWKVSVAATGSVSLEKDALGVVASWTCQSGTFSPIVEFWSAGTSASPSEAFVDRFSLSW
jgi:hypothetical protein